MLSNSLKDQSTSQLEQSLQAVISNTADEIARASAILYELRERKIWHNAMKTDLLKWFVEIHMERLHPEFVMMFAGTPTYVRAALGSSLKQQKEWADGGEVRIAEVNAHYEVVETKKPFFRLDAKDLNTAFNDGKIRPMTEQRKIAEKRIAPIAPSEKPKQERVRAHIEDEAIVINGTKYRIGELKAPLLALGYRLVRTQDQTQEASA